jgi:hypothetical protein
MTEATVTKKSKTLKAPKLFSDELIDQLLAQVQAKMPSRSRAVQDFQPCVARSRSPDGDSALAHAHAASIRALMM